MSHRPGRVVVVGGGLAGCEAAWQAARLGAEVTLYEMRPRVMTEAHKTGGLAELVCSNSFKSEHLSNANGLLKLELKMMGSMLMAAAAGSRVPAGSALCVDRAGLSEYVTRALEAHPRIEIVREEATSAVEDAVSVLAPGPLASPGIADYLENLVGTRNLFFYDAISPIVEADSIDMDRAFKASRYDKGESTYINLPLSREEYDAFIAEVRGAEVAEKREFEQDKFFSACMPIEELVRNGSETLAHGCMKPVGLADPRTGRMPHAVVQLRPENLEGTLYGMVGFQTRMKYGEQERIFRMLPGLERAHFVRLGSIHRNTYVCAPRVLLPTLEHRARHDVLLAGQITGAEGYVASMATGLLAGLNAGRKAAGRPCVVPPAETVLGGLARHVSQTEPGDFQPMNPNFGLLPRLGERVRERLRRNLLLSERSALAMKEWLSHTGLDPRSGERMSTDGVLS
jgi:methylenetetrahydrofolate--tRNA-(uracil-5-)-methyltransferase